MSESQNIILILLIAGIVCIIGAVKSDISQKIESSFSKNERLANALIIFMTIFMTAFFHEDHYVLFLIGTIILFIIVVLGLNVQLGFTGLINFSCASFFGIGGYTAAIVSMNYNIPPFIILILGGFFSAAIGSILLLPVLRTSGHYSALVTMAFALLFKVFLEVNPFFGGPQGIGVGSMTLFGWDFNDVISIAGIEISFYVPYVLFSLFLLVLAFVFVRRIERSWIGLSMDAVRIDETASACFGVNIQFWKITAFTVGNFLSGVSGALYAMMVAYISPANFSFADSLIFLSILLLGGLGSSWGVVLATVIVVMVPEKFQVIQEYRFFIYAALVLLMIVFRPMGLLPRKVRTFRQEISI